MEPTRLSTKLDNAAGEIINPARKEDANEIATLVDALYELSERLTMLTAARYTNGALMTYATGGTQSIGTVTTVTTLTGQTNIGGIPAVPMVPGQMNQTAMLSNIQNITIS